MRKHINSAVVIAHGAAFAAVEGPGLAWPIPDYEFEGFDERTADWSWQVSEFHRTSSPDLPSGLNVATQFDWLERNAPALFRRGWLLPLAQYWSWWLSGAMASEPSSFGCHTHLWSPEADGFSHLAIRREWVPRFAPMRKAWEVVGRVRPQLAQRLGLSEGLRVHVGAHDKNARLAAHLRTHARLTLVSTDDGIEVMSPGAPMRQLDAEADQLCHVSIRRTSVPTGRFGADRALDVICAGADLSLANVRDLSSLLTRQILALPCFETGGPFRYSVGRIVGADGLDLELMTLNEGERATLAALYAAQVTSWIIESLGGTGPVIVEGPLARNCIFTGVLAALVPHEHVRISLEPQESTVRGAWLLTRWIEPSLEASATEAAVRLTSQPLTLQHARWCSLV